MSKKAVKYLMDQVERQASMDSCEGSHMIFSGSGFAFPTHVELEMPSQDRRCVPLVNGVVGFPDKGHNR